MKNFNLRSKQEQGALPIGAIIAIAIVAAIIFVGIQLVPIYWDHWNFKDNANTSVQYVFVRYPREQVKKLQGEIEGGLKAIGADYEEKNVIVNVDERKKTASVEVWYTRSHKVPFIQNPLQFYVTAEKTE